MPDSVKLYPGDVYHIQPGGNCLYYNWFPPLGLSKTNISNPIAKPDVNTRYIVNARTEEGCSITDSIDVIVIPDSYIDVPNAFTPDGDGLNETFNPVYDCDIAEYNLKVFNRWGQLIYTTDQIQAGWDGEFNNRNVSQGIYLYVINYTPFIKGKPIDRVTKSGTVVVIY